MDDGEPRTRRNRAWKSDFCSCGNKLIEHTTELRIVLTYVGRGVSRPAQTRSLGTNESGMECGKQAPARQPSATKPKRGREISYNNGERQTLSPRTVRH